jgi:hypothetical protein
MGFDGATGRTKGAMRSGPSVVINFDRVCRQSSCWLRLKTMLSSLLPGTASAYLFRTMKFKPLIIPAPAGPGIKTALRRRLGPQNQT